jgi:hypothetical protein
VILLPLVIAQNRCPRRSRLPPVLSSAMAQFCKDLGAKAFAVGHSVFGTYNTVQFVRIK